MILGILLTIVGVIMTAIGGSLRNTWEYQAAKVAKAWGWLDAEEKFYIFIIDAIFVIGIIALILGIIRIVLKVIKKSSGGGKRGFSAPKITINVPNFTAPKKFACANCGTEVAENMAFCPNCGCAEKRELGAPVQQQTLAFCPNCGSAVNPGEAFCPRCGTKV